MCHGFGCVYMAYVPSTQAKTWNLDEIGNGIYVRLRILAQGVIECWQNLLRRQIFLRFFQIDRVFTRLPQLGVSVERPFQIPSNHSVSALEPVEREYALHRVAKDTNDPGSGH